MRPSAPTLQKIADVCRVHKSTVSLALRHSPTLPLSTRERIQRIAIEMGYRPDPALSAFNAHRRARLPKLNSRVIAWVTDENANLSFQHHSTLEAARTEAAQRGFQIDCFSVGSNTLPPSRLNRILLSRGVEAVLLVELPRARRRLDFSWQNFCVLAIDGFYLEEPIDTVALDLRQRSRRLTTEHLARKGPTLGLCLSPMEEDYNHERVKAGYLIAHSLASLPPPPIFVREREVRDQRAAVSAWARRHHMTHLLPLPSVEKAKADWPRTLKGLSLMQPTDGLRVGREAVRILVSRVDGNLRGLGDTRSITLIPDQYPADLLV